MIERRYAGYVLIAGRAVNHLLNREGYVPCGSVRAGESFATVELPICRSCANRLGVYVAPRVRRRRHKRTPQTHEYVVGYYDDRRPDRQRRLFQTEAHARTFASRLRDDHATDVKLQRRAVGLWRDLS